MTETVILSLVQAAGPELVLGVAYLLGVVHLRGVLRALSTQIEALREDHRHQVTVATRLSNEMGSVRERIGRLEGSGS